VGVRGPSADPSHAKTASWFCLCCGGPCLHMPSPSEWARNSSISWWRTMCKCNPHVFLPRQWLRRGDVARRGAVIGRSLTLWLSDRKLGPLTTAILMMTATLFVVLAI
jgi:hypothetical protein